MSCTQCELKRAKLLCETRASLGIYDYTEIMKELEYRWPNRFFFEYDTSDGSHKIMQRNTVAPYTPKEVYHYVNSTGNA